MRDKQYRNSFEGKLRFFVIISLSFTFLITTLIIATLSFAWNRKNISDLGQKQLELIATNIENEIDTIEKISLGLMFNSTIQKAIINPALLESYSEHNLIKYVLSDYKNFTDPGNIVLFDSAGQVITSSEGYSSYFSLKSMDYFHLVEESNGEPVWLPPHVDKYDFRNSQSTVVSLIQKIRFLDLNNPGNSGRVIGYILINIDTMDFYNILDGSNWFSEGHLVLEMDSGKSISSWGNKQEKSVFKLSALVSCYKWRLEGDIPFRAIFNITDWLLIGILIEVTLIIFFSHLASKLSRNITIPLKNIEKTMKNISLDSCNPQFFPTKITEIDSIQSSYKQMISRLQEVTLQLTERKLHEKELEVASVQAELSALQHQINPHFLYNTLDSINWMADAKGNTDIVDMISHLGDFLRFHTRAKGFVTLKQELDNVADYVYVQKIRYGSRFEYNAFAPAELMNTDVVPLIIQPLVENSLIHFEAGLEKLLVDVSVLEVDGYVTIKVEDTGNGIEEVKLEKIRTSIEKGESIGLANVAKRLKLVYGSSAVFSLHSTVGKGTSVILTYPLHPEKN